MEARSHGDQSASLRDYLRVVRRRKWIIFQAVLLIPAVAVGLSLSQDNVYKASAEVLLVQQNVANQLNDLNPSTVQPADRVAQTQADLARVPKVAEMALESAGVTGTAEDFLERSSATAKTNADLLQLSAWDHDPDSAITLAKAYADAFARFRSDLDTAPFRTAKKQANRQLREMAADGQEGSNAYQDLRASRDKADQMIALMTRNAVPVKAPDKADQIQPRPVRNGILGLALGIVLGVALAFLREALDTRVRTAEDVEERLGIPLLARVPEPPRKLRNRNWLIMGVDPHGVQAETFRTLRMNIEFLNLDLHARTIMVTSAIESEGKSTTAANLAVAFARMGKRVALVDLDLRRPFMHRFFDFGDRPGLTHVARGHASLEDATLHVALNSDEIPARVSAPIEPSKYGDRAVDDDGHDWETWLSIDAGRHEPAGSANGGAGNGRNVAGLLDVISSGPLPPDGGDFVSSGPVGELLGTLRERYEVVLIDSPPLLRVGDGIALSSRVDALLVMTRLNTLRRPILKELARVLASIPTSKLGFVVTGVSADDEDYAYHYQGAYRYAAPKASDWDKKEVRA